MVEKTHSFPECEQTDTDRVYSTFTEREVVEIRVCNDCPAEYEVVYADPVKETTNT